MPKILIVTDALGRPSFAPRMRFLSTFLHQKGWDVTLCCEDFSEICFQHYFRIKLIKLYRFKSGTLLHEIEWTIIFALNMLFEYKERLFLRKLKKAFLGEHFDIVCCSTFSTFPLRACRDFARHLNAPLHIDLRDIAEQDPMTEYTLHHAPKTISKLIIKRYVAQRNAVLRTAKVITTTTPWQQNVLNKINPNTKLIFNGFDADIFYPEDIHQSKFSMFYAGKLYSKEIQDPTCFFEAVSNLNKKNMINNSWFRIYFYVNDEVKKILLQEAAKYDITDYLYIHDYIDPKYIPQKIRECAISLVFTNKCTVDNTNGILPTKLYEGLGCEKPILCTRNDESVIEELITQTNAGIASSNVEEIEAFILEKIDEWRNNGYTHQPVIQEKKLLYSRQYQAEQFISIFEKLMQENN